MTLKPEVNAQPSGARLRRCKRCGSDQVVRAHRQGWQFIWSWFGIYPFKCEACDHRFNGPRKWI